MTMQQNLPKLLICHDIVWAKKPLNDFFDGIADIIKVESTDRADFLAGLREGGKYHGCIGIMRENSSMRRVGAFNAEMISALSASGIKWLANYGAGYDMIDVEACKKHHVTLSNTPGVVDDSTAIAALFLIMSCLRRFSQSERSLRQGEWRGPVKPGDSLEPTGKILAILGLGGIGLRLANLAHAFPMRVIYHSRNPNKNAPEWCEYFADRDEMLRQADVLSVHVPLRPETVGLVGEQMIRTMRPGSIVINTARGKVVDEEAMIKALEDGHLSSVGLDVFPEEPKVNPRLLEFPQCVLLPHIGTEDRDAQYQIEVRALTNLRDFITKGAGNDIVAELRG